MPGPPGVSLFLQGKSPGFTASLDWISGPAAPLLPAVSSGQRVQAKRTLDGDLRTLQGLLPLTEPSQGPRAVCPNSRVYPPAGTQPRALT